MSDHEIIYLNVKLPDFQTFKSYLSRNGCAAKDENGRLKSSFSAPEIGQKQKWLISGKKLTFEVHFTDRDKASV